MPDIYDRQRPMDLYTPNSVTVVGCGGIGSWVAILAAMSGVKTLFLYDPDTLEETNRNRLPFCQGSVGRPKVQVVADYIAGIRTDATVVPVQEKLDGIFVEIQLSITEFLIDCTDSPRSQIYLYNKCKERGGLPHFIRAGYDGTNITVTSNVSGWIRDTEQETYTVQPSWVVPAVTVAALAVGKMMKYNTQEVGLDLSEIGIPVLQRQSRRTARCAQAPQAPRAR